MRFLKQYHNQESVSTSAYGTGEYATEPIPGDRTWATKKKCGNCESCFCKAAKP